MRKSPSCEKEESRLPQLLHCRHVSNLHGLVEERHWKFQSTTKLVNFQKNRLKSSKNCKNFKNCRKNSKDCKKNSKNCKHTRSPMNAKCTGRSCGMSRMLGSPLRFSQRTPSELSIPVRRMRSCLDRCQSMDCPMFPCHRIWIHSYDLYRRHNTYRTCYDSYAIDARIGANIHSHRGWWPARYTNWCGECIRADRSSLERDRWECKWLRPD